MCAHICGVLTLNLTKVIITVTLVAEAYVLLFFSPTKLHSMENLKLDLK